MDFSDITDIAIPEGSVAKITDASGQVIWEKNTLTLNPIWQAKHVADFVNTGSPSNSTISGIVHHTGEAEYGIMLRDTDTGRVGDTLLWGTGTVAHGNKLYTLCISKPTIGSYPIFVKNVGNSTVNCTYALVTENVMQFYPNAISFTPINATPASDTSVYITGSPERGEYLLTGFTNGLAVMKTNATTSPTFYSSNLRKTCWASGMGSSGLYFGITGNDGNVSYSSDGINWQTITVHTNGSIISDIEYLSQRNKVCTISSNSTNSAILSNGTIDRLNQLPSKASLCAYSPEYDAFCIWSNANQKAYVTRNFSTWYEASMPNTATSTTYGISVSGTVNLRELIHIKNGIFLGYEHLGQRLCLLSIS